MVIAQVKTRALTLERKGVARPEPVKIGVPVILSSLKRRSLVGLIIVAPLPSTCRGARYAVEARELVLTKVRDFLEAWTMLDIMSQALLDEQTQTSAVVSRYVV